MGRDSVLRVGVPDAAVLEEILRDPLPLGLRSGGSHRVFHRDVYYDTADRMLEKRGVVCRVRIASGGVGNLTLKIRETPRGGPDQGNVFTATIAPDGESPFEDDNDVVRILQAIVDPDRLSPRVELETDRVVRTARHRWLFRPLFELHHDTVIVRAGERAGSFYEITIRRIGTGGPDVTRVSRELERRYRTWVVLGDKLARARAFFAAKDLESLEDAVRSAREVAILPFDLGRIGLSVKQGVLTVLSGPGSGEDGCRKLLREVFGSGEAQLRRLGTTRAVGDRPAMEVWLARRIPAARNPGSPLEWLLLQQAVSLVGSPSVRDARTLAALHLATRSDLMDERPVWAVHAPVPESMSLYLSDEMPVPEILTPAVADPALPKKALDVDRPDPEQFINRDLSQLAFNSRVLELAEDPRVPLLERVRFLSIFASNMDEVFMVRVGALKYVLEQGTSARSIDGLTTGERLDAIGVRSRYLMARAYDCVKTSLLPGLAPEGVKILAWEDLDEGQRADLERQFHEDIYPVLTPLAASPGHPFPHIPDLAIAIAVTVRQAETGVEHFAAVIVPSFLHRFLTVNEGRHFIPIESVIAANLESLFPGLAVQGAYWFRATRSSEVPIDEWHSFDLLQAIEEKIERRVFGPVVRLEVEQSMPPSMRELLLQEFRFEEPDAVSSLSETDLYEYDSFPDLTALKTIADLDAPELHYPVFHGRSQLPEQQPVMDVVRERDHLFHFPYDSFESTVERFLVEAADDPAVLAIKLTLYRTNEESRVVDALIRAAQNGKQVLAIVELKARFEEERNIEWVKALEGSGIHVVYGLLGLKTHCKIGLVVRREDRLRRYSFVGSGNLNADTARLYTDLALLTADPDIAADLNDVFNSLSGNATQREYRRLLVAPVNMFDRFYEFIEREIDHARHGRPARIRAKMNGLADQRIITALYKASQAGVDVDLIVRGICVLRPGVRGLSDRIRVVSILGRFLEHVRMFHFANGGDDEFFVGSADWRPRNLRRRVEVVAPVTDAACQARMDHIFTTELADGGAWELGPDASYSRRLLEEPTAQERMMGLAVEDVGLARDR